ncbi:MAG TPA: hypothetical protein VHF45_06155 [Thermoleophilaceae bacterium]|nr:hypothetical protein [Thermoleophilaceae bacterium]
MSVGAAADWRDRQVSAAEAASVVRPVGDHSLSVRTEEGVEELTMLF